jgi:hypothetical protein
MTAEQWRTDQATQSGRSMTTHAKPRTSFLGELATFIQGFEQLALNGADVDAARRLAACTRPQVVAASWVFLGHSPTWADFNYDPDKWRDAWLAILRQIGYTVNCQSAQRPGGGELTVYRGCQPAGRFGLAWSPDPGTAHAYATLAGPGAAVYAHKARPCELLLTVRHAAPQLAAAKSGYDEYVLDPQYLHDDNIEVVDRL